MIPARDSGTFTRAETTKTSRASTTRSIFLSGAHIDSCWSGEGEFIVSWELGGSQMNVMKDADAHDRRTSLKTCLVHSIPIQYSEYTPGTVGGDWDGLTTARNGYSAGMMSLNMVIAMDCLLHESGL